MLLNPGMNVYDIRNDCVGPLCYDFSRLDAYLAQPDVRKALGVGDRRSVASPPIQQDRSICAVFSLMYVPLTPLLIKRPYQLPRLGTFAKGPLTCNPAQSHRSETSLVEECGS